MKRYVLWVLTLTLLWFATPAGAQTNPCLAPLPAFSIVTSRTIGVYQTIFDYDQLFGGQPVLTDVEVAVYAKGADLTLNPAPTPIASVTLTKSSFAVVAGTNDCYRATVMLAPTVLVNTEYDLYTRGKMGSVAGPWNAAAERVPFGQSGPPAARRGTRVGQ